MLRLLLPILLSALSPGDDNWKPTDTELRRAHELLAGSWKFLSIAENGELLGPHLVETRFARDGIVTIADRKFNIVNPVSGEKRAATFRIDPSKTPRRIDLVMHDDRLLRGIYQFEGDTLIICLQPDESRAIPNDFLNSDGPDLITLRLKAIPAAVATTASASSGSVGALRPVPSNARSIEPIREQGPSESELRRAHELLSGKWDIISMKDDGEQLGSDLIRAKFAENGRIEVGTRKLRIIAPGSGERRLSTIRIDPSKTPSEIDVTTQFDEVLKGIYQFNGDQLMVCLAKRDGDDRPTKFEAPRGSGDLLFQLRMAPT